MILPVNRISPHFWMNPEWTNDNEGEKLIRIVDTSGRGGSKKKEMWFFYLLLYLTYRFSVLSAGVYSKSSGVLVFVRPTFSRDNLPGVGAQGCDHGGIEW